ncbi:hypothetical protein ACFQMM_06395 [Saliphagus sp. GCM10025308]
MVEDRITDGRRIAELLASEIDGRADDELASLAVTNADRNVEPAVGGARAFDISFVDEDGDPLERLARVFVHPDRAHLEFDQGREAAVDAAGEADLRTRPKATTPAKTLVFLERAATVKRGVTVVQAAARDTGGR